MKKIKTSKAGVRLRLALAVSLLIFPGSCQKISETDHTGGDPGGSPGPTANEVFIQGSAFSPSSITVAANTTIKWINKDTAPHTVTSDGGAFNSGTINTNGTFSHTFTAAGTYSYHCTFHPTMTGSVTAN